MDKDTLKLMKAKLSKFEEILIKMEKSENEDFLEEINS